MCKNTPLGVPHILSDALVSVFYVSFDWSSSPRLCWSPRCPRNRSAPPLEWSLASPPTLRNPPSLRRRRAATAAAATTAGPARLPSPPARSSNPSPPHPRLSCWPRGVWLDSLACLLPCCPACPVSLNISNSSPPRLPHTFPILRDSSTDKSWGFCLNMALQIDERIKINGLIRYKYKNTLC